MVPFDDQSPFVTSGIRIGTAAVTTRGFKEQDCVRVVDWIDNLVQDIHNEDLIKKTSGEVKEFMRDFPLYA